METIPLMMRYIRAEMRQHASSLSVPQFRTLGFLDRNPGASLSQLAEHLGVTRATASALTERLVQRQLVHRTEHPKERRQIVLTLTEDGLHHLEAARAVTREKIANLFAHLPAAQLADVMDGLAILSHVFEEPIA